MIEQKRAIGLIEHYANVQSRWTEKYNTIVASATAGRDDPETRRRIKLGALETVIQGFPEIYAEAKKFVECINEDFPLGMPSLDSAPRNVRYITDPDEQIYVMSFYEMMGKHKSPHIEFYWEIQLEYFLPPNLALLLKRGTVHYEEHLIRMKVFRGLYDCVRNPLNFNG